MTIGDENDIHGQVVYIRTSDGYRTEELVLAIDNPGSPGEQGPQGEPGPAGEAGGANLAPIWSVSDATGTQECLDDVETDIIWGDLPADLGGPGAMLALGEGRHLITAWILCNLTGTLTSGWVRVKRAGTTLFASPLIVQPGSGGATGISEWACQVDLEEGQEISIQVEVKGCSADVTLTKVSGFRVDGGSTTGGGGGSGGGGEVEPPVYWEATRGSDSSSMGGAHTEHIVPLSAVNESTAGMVNSTSRVTPGVAGMYSVSVYVYYFGGGYMDITLKKNGVSHRTWTQINNFNAFQGGGGTWVLRLDADDYLELAVSSPYAINVLYGASGIAGHRIGA